jgi:hypothetical protein
MNDQDDQRHLAEIQRGLSATHLEQKRLEATALVASKVSREESQIIVRREKIKTLLREGIIALLVIAVAILGYRNLTEAQRTKAALIVAQQINCRQYSDIASIPLSNASTRTALSLVADFRNSYYAFECQRKYGQLNLPDPKLLPFLNNEAKQGSGAPVPEETVPVPPSTPATATPTPTPTK